jgi:hypothetical protein
MPLLPTESAYQTNLLTLTVVSAEVAHWTRLAEGVFRIVSVQA